MRPDMIIFERMKCSLYMCAAAAAMVLGGCREAKDEVDIVVGTYGGQIYRYSFDRSSLEFSLKGTAEAKDPSYVLARGNDLFAVSECGGDSGIYSFTADTDGAIRQTAELHQTGADPCFLMLYEEGAETYAMTADYSGGSVSMFPIKEGAVQERCAQLRFTGSGPVTQRQEASHIHQLKEVPEAEGYVLASDLGADVIRVLKVNEGNMVHLGDITCPAGSGPRHLEFGKGEYRDILYCMAELSGDVLVYSMKEGSTMPSDFTLIQQIRADEANAGGSADIHIHPSGKWLYTSHRLENDGISTFSIKEDGTLEKTGYVRTGIHPRNFMITAQGDFLLVACRDDRMVQVFGIGEDGSLIPTSGVLMFESDRPSSVTEVIPSVNQ